ncbi:electron transport complex subunit RsxD [Andreesenia angusta]|uniref:Ion-translocating oxidoreductase complex subunit D n=1 Tax=Andreesenia angusta TaxID=39480 RepID=A0A1S1V7V3_9FIRM|nr:RnfABCDGE type electron transport complex subunit D [Andreesenia angusta]OHW62490.1 electron transport complex subunit RsxD [Andreesenia angusta]
MQERLLLTSSPHIGTKDTVSRVMLDVIIALLPATMGSIYFFGLPAFKLIMVSVIAAVATEAIIQKLTKKTITIKDCSAALTGLLLAMNIPPAAPWWIAAVGSAFAIGIAKQAFGGLGQNFINPALAGRAMLMASWPVIMTTWSAPGADAVATVTPLALLKPGSEATGELPSLMDAFVGNIGGCLGETSALLLLIGAAYLFYRRVISWRIPFTYIATVAVITLVASGGDFTNMLYHLFTGGLMIGAFFMATDYSSSPITVKGQIIFGIGAGVITSVIRLYGGYPEGVSYSILLMNLAAPIIEKYTSPKLFGEVK